MTRGSLINALQRSILRRVPKEDRPDARAQLIAIDEAWNVIVEDSIRSAYAKALREAEDQDEQQRKAGFQLGYDHAIERVMGQVGAPARRVDEDDLTASVS
jgi:hypothetical protein